MSTRLKDLRNTCSPVHFPALDRAGNRVHEPPSKRRTRGTTTMDTIELERGVSWSTFAALPGWMPVRDSPVDFMHGVFLGENFFMR